LALVVKMLSSNPSLSAGCSLQLNVAGQHGVCVFIADVSSIDNVITVDAN